MLKIAICEDENVQTELLVYLINKWTKEKVHIKSFISAESFYFEWSENKDFDILLLDIEMAGENGMSLAKRIREEDKDIIIIFVTGLEEYMLEGYEVNAFNYLLKPLNEDKFFKCLDKAYERIKDKPEKKTIVLNSNKGIVKINEEDIIKIEAYLHNLVVTTLKDEFEIKKSLASFEKELDENIFFKCHRSVIINLKHVERINSQEVLLEKDNKAPVSRRMYPKLNKAFIDFYRGEGND